VLINQITEKECYTILGRASIGRLGCCLNNQPYVVPIFFAYETGYVYAFSTLGQKIKWMRTNPEVCLEVDEIATDFQWASVIVSGRYQELVEPQYTKEHAHARALLSKRYRWWQTAAAERQLRSGDNIDPLFFRIRVDSITGLRAEHIESPAA